MRTGNSLICVLLLLLAGAVLAAAAGPVLETLWDQSQVRISDSGAYAKLALPGTRTIDTPGAPALPIEVLHFVIPADSRVEDVIITRLSEEELPGTYRIFPAQPDVPTGETAKWVEPDPAIYEAGGSYPDRRARVLSDGFLAGYRIASVAVYPLTYEPATGKLTLARTLEVALSLTSGRDRSQPRHRTTSRSDALYRRLVEGLVANPSDLGGRNAAQVEVADVGGAEGFAPRYTPSLEGSPVEYVIVTSDEFAPQFQTLADWKTKKGVPTVVRTVPWIDANYPGGCDTAERIRLFLKDALASWGTTFALLGGDTDVVPIRYAWTRHYGGWSIPTDLYYSDLDGNWNDDGDNIFGESYVAALAPGDSIDLYPDIFVGRAPVADALEVETFIEKTLAYERQSASSFAPRNLCMAEVMFPYDWVPGEMPGLDGAEDIAEPALPLTPEWIRTIRLYQRFDEFPGSFPLNHDSAIDSLSRGYNITSHIGHGNKDLFRVSRDNYVTLQDADAIGNGIHKSGFLWMLNCSTAYVDAECVGERFMNNPGGGCSFLFGATRFCFPVTTGDYYYEWFDLLYTQGVTEGGVVSASCKVPFVVEAQRDGTDRWTQMTYILLGDPETSLWTGLPRTLTVENENTAVLGPTVYAVTVTDPDPVEGALVCIVKEDEVYATAQTDASGQAVLSFTPRTTGLMMITVTAQDHHPHETGAVVMPSPDPHLTLRETAIDDDTAGWSNGNGNGQAEAGELIELDITVGNGGQSHAAGVTATLHDGDPYVSLIDGVHYLDEIPALSEIRFEDALLISVADSCPNGYEAVLELTMTDASRTTWTDAVVIRVSRPELLQYHNDFDDGPAGNGVPEVGDTVALVVDVFNDGNGLADQVSGLLRYPGAGVTVIDSTDTWGDIPPGSAASGQTGFAFTVDAALAESFELILVDEDGKEWRYPFDVVGPAAIEGLTGSVKGTTISLVWGPSDEGDLWGYNVYRADHPGGAYEPANDGVIDRISYFEDRRLDENSLYFYRVTAVDLSGNESALSEILEISTNPPSQVGWPLAGGEGNYGTPAIVDLDLDG